MTIVAQLKQVRDAFAAWAQGNSGVVAIAADPYQLVVLLRTASKAMSAVVMFHGETKRGEYEERGAVDRTFWVVITRGQGLKLEPGANLIAGVADGKPLFDLVEEARETIRHLSFDDATTEVTPNVTEISPFNTEGFLMDAYKIVFSIGVQLPAVDVTAEPTAPDPETAV